MTHAMFMLPTYLTKIKAGLHPIHKNKAVTGLSHVDLLHNNHRSVSETVTCMHATLSLLICCLLVTQLPQVCSRIVGKFGGGKV